MEKVSIIIPAYNAEKDIARCLSSAVNQSYKNTEILIINDGSEDCTEKICSEYISKYNNIRLINAKHRGVSCARNQGIEHASGDWIFFLDADDTVLVSGIELLMKYRNKGEWIIGNYEMVDVLNSREPVLHRQYFKGDIHCGERGELPQLCVSRYFNYIWGKLYRKDIIFVNKISFDRNQNYGEDLLFNLEYFRHVNHFVILKEPIYQYCYRFGEGLGTRFIKDEWEIQKKFITYIETLCRDTYALNSEQLAQMNIFYYMQAIAALQRIADEGSLSFTEKQQNMRKITDSKLFMEILEKEYSLKRIKSLDYFLLKENWGYIYHTIHRLYVKLKSSVNRGN